ncbi:hypothetical protein KUL42_32730 [Alteromonas sp. KUL42]|uniref:hypothetical protein n=1 Tax=Alteromonas sp. KUL42 TaxID=2480797 RepID=UPI0010FFC1B1|nr:hypothetical protein [Alteromonas sp. KUL42]GEA08512.1 hypothetical protein KUL42_32730 [Alteromonas sp. KUL42]
MKQQENAQVASVLLEKAVEELNALTQSGCRDEIEELFVRSLICELTLYKVMIEERK